MTILYDTETTGLPKVFGTDLKLQPQIIEFAAIKLGPDLQEIARLEFFANPGKPLPPEIPKLNGITDDMLKDEKPFENYLPQLQDFFLGARSLVAHNLRFDKALMTFELQRLNAVTRFPWPPNNICTVEASHFIKNRRMKLCDLYKHITGEEAKDQHRAMGDVETMLVCFRWLREQGAL